MKSKLKAINDNLENITGGYKYYIDSSGKKILLLDCKEELDTIEYTFNYGCEIRKKAKAQGHNLTFEEIFAKILAEHGFKNTASKFGLL